MQHLIAKAHDLTEEALPYLQKFKGKIVVIKYGGKAMTNEELKKSVMKDIAFLHTVGIRVVIVHGGGPEINADMEKAKLKPKFVHGLRVTDAATMRIIVKVFRRLNEEIQDNLEVHGIPSEDVKSSLLAEVKEPSLGLVGKVVGVKVGKILKVLRKGKVPVISPIGVSDSIKYNINADTAATKIAIALNAEKLTILTDVDGVLGKNGTLISRLSKAHTEKMIASGVISKGMIPKVQACVEAVESGCKKAHLINGTVPHSLLFEIFTDEGIGTEIVKTKR